MIEALQPWVIFATSTLALLGTLYAVMPKTWRTLHTLNRFGERIHTWLKRNIIIPEVYDRLNDHEERITTLEQILRTE